MKIVCKYRKARPRVVPLCTLGLRERKSKHDKARRENSARLEINPIVREENSFQYLSLIKDKMDVAIIKAVIKISNMILRRSKL